MKSIFRRAHLTVFRVLGTFESWITIAVNWIFNDLIELIYNNVIVYVFMVLTYAIMLLSYVPLYIILFPFSVFVEIFDYTKKTQMKKKVSNIIITEEEKFDLINKKK